MRKTLHKISYERSGSSLLEQDFYNFSLAHTLHQFFKLILREIDAKFWMPITPKVSVSIML